MRRSIEALVAASKRAWARKAMWIDIIDEAFLYAAPGLNPYLAGAGYAQLHGEQAGQFRHDHLFDGTLAVAAEKHANRMVAELFPAGHDWAEMTQGPFFGMEDDPPARIREAMESIQKKTFQAIHASNFYLAANMMALDGVIAGTGLMKVGISQDASTLIEFDACSQAEVALEKGPRGQVWGFFRKLWLQRDGILSMWPMARQLPERDRGEGNEPKHHDVLECTYYDPQASLWRYEVILRGEGHGDRRMYHREYRICPWVVWRYSLLPGEVQGRSPCFKATPAARTVNHAKRVLLETASIRGVPAFTYKSDGVLNPNNVRIAPGALIAVESNEHDNPTLRPLEAGGDLQLQQIVIEDERAAINAALLNNVLPEPTGAVRSATESIERQREALQTLGSPYLRIVEEVGRPVLRAVVQLLAEMGHMEELEAFGQQMEDGTPAPLRLDGSDVEVKFTSPLVLTQQLSDAQTIVQWGEYTSVFGPEALTAGAKTELVAAELGDRLGVSETLIRRPEDANEMLMQQMAAGTPTGQQAPQGMGMAP